ncbi:IS66 family transposase [Pararhizobium antarcticum]|uniref:IS66 family transposase n=1 Tax=Pararhizobium antarcticum TaxID=1798805 RepID=UPI001114EB9D
MFSNQIRYYALDKRLSRLKRRKGELLRVLERPEPPLHTNASERDLRGFVIKRKISGGMVSRNGRQAGDSMLGLMKTCQKLGLSFWHHLGDRLGIGNDDHFIPPLHGCGAQLSASGRLKRTPRPYTCRLYRQGRRICPGNIDGQSQNS